MEIRANKTFHEVNGFTRVETRSKQTNKELGESGTGDIDKFLAVAQLSTGSANPLTAKSLSRV